MLKSSVRFIIRHLWNNRLYSAIKILGLSLGMACVLLAVLFVRDENSFDKFHEKAARLYRITTLTNNPGNGGNQIVGATGQVQGPAFKAGVPEIEEYTRVMSGLSTNFIGDQKPLLINYIYADESFFKVFSFPLLYGNASDALKNLTSIVLTEQTALRFFGTTDVVGKIINLEEGRGRVAFIITGVARTLPVHSSIRFEAVIPFKYLQTMFSDNSWLNPYLSTFVLLNPKADVNSVKNKFAQIFRKEADVQLKDAGMTSGQVQFGLQPMADIHLNILEKGAKAATILSGIAAFILIMSCVNFLNLSIAGSLKRSKEIGVRKISGGSRAQIVGQFLSESSILCGISYILAAILVITALPVFNQLAQKKISLSFPSDMVFFLYGLIWMGICTLLVGLYPAIRLSMFNAAEVLYNKQKIKGKNIFTGSLIVFQFSFAVGLVMASIIYYRQMNFISHNNPGYNASDLIKIHLPNYRNVNPDKINALRNEMISEPSVVNMTNGDMTPTGDVDAVDQDGGKIKAHQSKIDQFFLPTLDIHVKEGRNFSSDFGDDMEHAVIANETFVREAGLINPIGKQITLTDGLGINHKKTIVGVVEDYHYASLKEKIGPLILTPDQSEYIWIKLQKGKAASALAALERIFIRNFPEYYFQYDYVDEEISNLYADEQRWKQIIGYASALAILICCMGLFGLAHFSTVRRTKEIGIRKVLGASAIKISWLLSEDFMKLVILSIIVASPAAWYVTNNWLQNFNYRIHISWTDFTWAGVIALAVALITISTQTFKAAIGNPVNCLRTE